MRNAPGTTCILSPFTASDIGEATTAFACDGTEGMLEPVTWRDSRGRLRLMGWRVRMQGGYRAGGTDHKCDRNGDPPSSAAGNGWSSWHHKIGSELGKLTDGLSG